MTTHDKKLALQFILPYSEHILVALTQLKRGIHWPFSQQPFMNCIKTGGLRHT